MPTAAKGEVVNYYSNNDYINQLTSINRRRANQCDVHGDGEGIEFWFCGI
jgi:hypothetical protein